MRITTKWHNSSSVASLGLFAAFPKDCLDLFRQSKSTFKLFTSSKHRNIRQRESFFPFPPRYYTLESSAVWWSRREQRSCCSWTELIDGPWPESAGVTAALWPGCSRGRTGLRRCTFTPRCVLICDDRRLLIWPRARTSYSSTEVFLYLEETEGYYIHLWGIIWWDEMKNLITRNKGERTLRQRKERSQDTSGKAKYRTHTQSDFFLTYEWILNKLLKCCETEKKEQISSVSRWWYRLRNTCM